MPDMRAEQRDPHRLIDLRLKTRKLLSEMKTAGIRDTKQARQRFHRNIERLSGLAALPVYLIGTSMVLGHLGCVAAMKATKNKSSRPGDLTPGQTALARKYFNQLQAKSKSYFGLDARKIRGYHDPRRIFNLMLTKLPKELDSGFQLVICSIVVGAWTAFESLAEDLWVAALNARPRLALMAMDAEIKDATTGSDDEKKRRITFPLPVWKITQKGFNLGKQMGDLLRNWQWDFSQRGAALKAYRKTFPKFKTDLDAIFLSKDLKWLIAARNVIVHNGGLIDQQFADEAKEHPQFRIARVGQPIPIDAGIAYGFTMTVVKSGLSLLDLVDSWLKNNPR